MDSISPDVIAAVSAGLSAIATLFAAMAAWRAPKNAARLAEDLRQANEKSTEQRRMKFYIFTTLMQERAAVYSSDAVRALNLIDVVFAASGKVREAWAELYNAYGDRQASDFDKQSKLRTLLKEMADDLGLSSGLRVDDFGRVYFPNALAEEEELRMLERKNALERLKGPATAQKALTYDPFPPKPEK